VATNAPSPVPAPSSSPAPNKIIPSSPNSGNNKNQWLNKNVNATSPPQAQQKQNNFNNNMKNNNKTMNNNSSSFGGNVGTKKNVEVKWLWLTDNGMFM
jgi:hypothetical protein